MLSVSTAGTNPIRFQNLVATRAWVRHRGCHSCLYILLLTQALLDVLDMVARHHNEHLNAFQQPPPLDESHWSQTSEEGSDLHSPVIYEQTFVQESGACAFRFPRTL